MTALFLYSVINSTMTSSDHHLSGDLPSGHHLSTSEYKRICWASRRGMLELDLILVPFVKNRFLSLGVEDQNRYIKLLEDEDTNLFTWFLGREKPENSELAIIVDQILAYHHQQGD